MGLLDGILGNKKGDSGPGMDMPMMGMDPYSGYAQGIDPAAMQMLNAPQSQGNAQIAQFSVENDEIIETIKVELQGYRIVRNYDFGSKQETIKKELFGEPVMNDMGINETCRTLRMFLSKPFVLSNFPKEDRGRIDTMMKILWKKLASNYATMGSQYQLDKSRRSGLAFSIVSMVYMNVMRSYEDGERPRMYGSHKTLQSIQSYGNPAGQQPQKKFMGIFG